MVTFLNIILFLALIWMAYCIVSFAMMVWKSKKRMAALTFYLIAVMVIVLPVFTIFLRVL